jgi:hypothetical protein
MTELELERKLRERAARFIQTNWAHSFDDSTLLLQAADALAAQARYCARAEEAEGYWARRAESAEATMQRVATEMGEYHPGGVGPGYAQLREWARILEGK